MGSTRRHRHRIPAAGEESPPALCLPGRPRHGSFSARPPPVAGRSPIVLANKGPNDSVRCTDGRPLPKKSGDPFVASPEGLRRFVFSNFCGHPPVCEGFEGFFPWRSNQLGRGPTNPERSRRCKGQAISGRLAKTGRGIGGKSRKGLRRRLLWFQRPAILLKEGRLPERLPVVENRASPTKRRKGPTAGEIR